MESQPCHSPRDTQLAGHILPPGTMTATDNLSGETEKSSVVSDPMLATQQDPVSGARSSERIPIALSTVFFLHRGLQPAGGYQSDTLLRAHGYHQARNHLKTQF